MGEGAWGTGGGAAVGKAGTLVPSGPPLGSEAWGREESRAGPGGESLVACAALRKSPSSSRGVQIPVCYQAWPKGCGVGGEVDSLRTWGPWGAQRQACIHPSHEFIPATYSFRRPCVPVETPGSLALRRPPWTSGQQTAVTQAES